ncbi:uncharacterized protein LOC144158603 isoform X7 [Haemaphysalis longicornis]
MDRSVSSFRQLFWTVLWMSIPQVVQSLRQRLVLTPGSATLIPAAQGCDGRVFALYTRCGAAKDVATPLFNVRSLRAIGTARATVCHRQLIADVTVGELRAIYQQYPTGAEETC